MSFVTTTDEGVLEVLGVDRIDLLHRLTTRNLLPLQDGGCREYTVFANQKGRVVDWVCVVALADRLLLRVSPRRAELVREWVDRYTVTEDLQISDAREAWRAARWVSEDDQVLDQFAAWHADTTGFPVDPSRFASLATAGGRAIGLDREGGVWWRSPWDPRGIEGLLRADSILARAMGAPGAATSPNFWESRRIALGVPSPEFEFATDAAPLELNLERTSVSWNKGCYIGQEVISRLDSYDKVARRLIGIVGSGPPPAPGTRLSSSDSPSVGRITSSTVDWDRGAQFLALALVQREFLGAHEFEIEDGRQVFARPLPFGTFESP